MRRVITAILVAITAVVLPLFAALGQRGADQSAPARAPDTASGRGPAAVRPLPFLYDVYTFRGKHGTAVVAAYAVEARALEHEYVGKAVRYRFDVSLVLADTARQAVLSRHDSVYVDLPRPLPGDHLLFTAIEVEAAPSTTTVQRVYMYNATMPGIGQLYSRSFVIPDYGGTELMLSDIALGQPDADFGWKRGGTSLALLPTQQFPSSDFDVYYEIYNLPPRHEYRTAISVAEIGRGGDETPLVRLSFTREAPAGGATLAELRRVETSLGRGRYRISIDITDAVTGATARKSRDFEVHAGRRTASMVPALPVAASAFRR
jgi:hypothetical protein